MILFGVTSNIRSKVLANCLLETGSTENIIHLQNAIKFNEQKMEFDRLISGLSKSSAECQETPKTIK